MRRRLIAGAVLLVVPRPALAETPAQGGALGGIECFEDCTETAATASLHGLYLVSPALGIGFVAEYTNTENEHRTDTVRFGAAMRIYASRGGLLEPYGQIALGPAWFTTHSGGCATEAPLFAQLALGIELRIVDPVFVGVGGATTASAWAGACDESNTGPEYTPRQGPRFGAGLSLRFGPAYDHSSRATSPKK